VDGGPGPRSRRRRCGESRSEWSGRTDS
jgi:hypothetical protein